MVFKMHCVLLGILQFLVMVVHVSALSCPTSFSQVWYVFIHKNVNVQVPDRFVITVNDVTQICFLGITGPFGAREHRNGKCNLID